MIPYGRQDITEQDIAAVHEVLASDFLTQGPAVPRFEAALAQHVGACHAIAVSSATAALHVACRALGLGPGDCLWTSPVTFVASANCALYCGASVDFVDIDSQTWNLSVPALADKLVQARRAGRLPKIVVPVDLCGRPCDLSAIWELSREFGFAVLEDASHAVGATYRGEPVGSGRYADITVFSFHPVKIITTAEGGAALTNDKALAEKMALLRSHGITRDSGQMTNSPEGPWYYQQIELGYNYRMTDLQAALGRSQLARLDEYVARRQELAQRYNRLLAHLPVETPYPVDRGSRSALHLYVVRLMKQAGRDRRSVFDALRAGGIGVNVHYIPVHTQPYYQALGFRPGDYPNAEAYYRSVITLPLFPTMTAAEQDRVVQVLTEALGR